MLNDIFSPNRIKNLSGTTKDDVLEELIETITDSKPECDHRELFDAVHMRESKMHTIIKPGIAVPRGYCSNINGVIGAIGFSREGIEYDDPDSGSQQPVHLVFLLIMDEVSREKHLRVLSRLLEMLNSPAFSRLKSSKNPDDFYKVLNSF